jgi:hypothetical protein
MPENLPLHWVQRIHQRLGVRYGTAHTARYEAIPADDLWKDWAEQLAGLTADAISYGIQHLPDDAPPNAAQFAAICRRCPQMTPPKLEAPKSDNPALRELAKAAAQVQRDDGREWARRLRDKEAWQTANPREVSARDRLTLPQRAAWREALGVESTATAAAAMEA